MRFPRKTGMVTERGFTLIEVIVATVIAVLAVVGLAQTFGNGRALIDRYAAARDAHQLAQQRIELMTSFPADTSVLDPDQKNLVGPFPIQLNDDQNGLEQWYLEWINDPLDDNPGPDPDPRDYKRVTVIVSWMQGANMDSVRLSRIFPAH